MLVNEQETIYDLTYYKNAAKKVASILDKHAVTVDKEACFPEESLMALKESGLMGMLVPKEYSGNGASITSLSTVAQILAGSCLSTSMIWAMHCQQVATIINHADEMLKQQVLPNIAQGDFVASVTSEYNKGGHLLTANSALEKIDDLFQLDRQAPIVTGGAYGDYYLVTMRADEESHKSEVKLVLVKRDEAEIDIDKIKWDSLGMRGTQSVSLKLSSCIKEVQIINKIEKFQTIAQKTMIPIGHIAWVSCWLGATKSVFSKVLKAIRHPKTRPNTLDLKSELFLEKLARIRIKIDTVDTYLNQILYDYNQYLNNFSIEISNQDNRNFNIKINTLKIIGSEYLYEAVNELIDLIGLSIGYLRNDFAPLERTLRDLRSASLMYNNYRLLTANGKLALLDTNLL
ncbi:acyl-CoA dehydrogenase family protein [Bacillus cereus]|uniref:acyl-CoA dehydrogenase family protein n=1 Tax=Bacillus cereus TaxID=1396 RepID=UPI002ED9746A